MAHMAINISRRRKLFAKSVLLSNLAFACFLPTATGAQDRDLSQDQLSPIERALHPPVSLDTHIVDVRFGNIVYAIPRNYLVGVTQPRDENPYAAFTIQLLLPDLAPRTAETTAELDRTGWHDQLRALFQYGKYPIPREELLKFYLDISKQAETDFRMIGGKYRLYERPNNTPSEIYTADTPNGLFLFTCESEYEFKVPISPSCTVMESLGNNVGVTYYFSRRHLMEAADIDLKVRSLLHSFARHD
jgi:hypothetical protein